MSLLGEAAVENRAGDLPSRVGPTPVEGLRKSDSIRSVGNLGQPVSSEEGPPRAKRARRDAVTKVWEWLDVSLNREASLPLGVVDLGHMKLSEGSPATTAVTAALDAPPCDVVEPCVSSLPDGQGLDASEGALLRPGSLNTTSHIDRAAFSSASLGQGPDEASSRRHDAAGSPTHFNLEARGSSTPIGPAEAPAQPSNDPAMAAEQRGAADAIDGPEGSAGGERPSLEPRSASGKSNLRKRKLDRNDGYGGSCGADLVTGSPSAASPATQEPEPGLPTLPGTS